MKKKDSILKLIEENKEEFQVNFHLIKQKERVLNEQGRMINIDKYQTNELFIDHFYKKISRIIK